MNEKSIFRFLVFELWSILYWKLIENWPILSTKLTISQKLNIGKLFSQWLEGFIPIKDMQTPSPKKWSDFYERCGLCCIEWKTKYIFFRFLFFELSWKIRRKFGWSRHKNDQKMTIGWQLFSGICPGGIDPRSPELNWHIR